MKVAIHRLDVDAVTLSVEERGHGTPLLLLHGFTGSAAGLAPLAEALGRRHRVLAPDLLGHGASEAPSTPAPYAFERCLAQLAGVLETCLAAPAHVFGYSMGGRLALGLALHRPDLVRSLALLGASAGLADPGERAARRASDAKLAERIECDGVPAFAEEWAALPLFASQRRRLAPEVLAGLHARRLGQRAHGLAHSLRGAGSGSQPAYHAEFGALTLPVWLGFGAEDTKFAAIARDLASRLPGATCAPIPAAGHAAHLENPDALLAELLRFLANAEAAPRPRPLPETLRAPQGAIR